MLHLRRIDPVNCMFSSFMFVSSFSPLDPAVMSHVPKLSSALERLQKQQRSTVEEIDAKTPGRAEGGTIVRTKNLTPRLRDADANPAEVRIPSNLRPFSAGAVRQPKPPAHTQDVKPSFSLTERIGALESKKNIRTYFREKRMTPQLSRRTYVTGPAPARPVSARKHDGVQGNDPYLSHFLDASDFDDADFETDLDNEVTNSVAFSPYYSVSGDKSTMEPCKILSFDHTTRTFLIRWIRSGRTKSVRSLLLKFQHESEEDYAARLAQASKRRDAEEAQLRLRNFILESEEEITPSSEEETERVLLRVAKEFPKRHIELMKSCLEEAEEMRNFGVKRAIVEYKLLDDAEQERLKPLRLPALDKKPSPDLRRCQCTIEIGDRMMPFANARSFLSSELFAAYPALYSALRFAVNRWFAFDQRLLIDLETCTTNAPQELLDFQIHQSKYNELTATSLREAWMNSIVGCLQSELSTTFNFFEDSLERFKVSRMYRFLRMLHLCLGGQLQGLVYASLENLERFAQSLRLPNVLLAAVEAEQQGSDRTDGSFLRTVGCVATRLIEPPAFRASNSNVPLPEPHAEDSAKGTISIYGTQPLIVVRLEATSCGVNFEPTLDQVHDAVKQLFHYIFSATDTIADLTGQLYPLLAVPAEPLTKQAQEHRHEDRRVVSCERAVDDMLQENFRGPLALLKLYQPFDYLLTIDVEKWMEDFVDPRKSPPKLVDYDSVCERLHEHIDAITTRSLNEVAFPLLKVETFQLKGALKQKAQSLIARVLTRLIDETNAWIEDVSKRYEDIHSRLLFEPANPDELKEMKDFVDGVPILMKELEEEFDEITANVQLLGKYGFIPDQSAFEKYWNSVAWPKRVDDVMLDLPGRLQSYRAQFHAELRELTENLQIEIKDVSREVAQLAYEDDVDADIDKMVGIVEKLEAKLDNLRQRSNQYTSHEKIFQMPVTRWTALREAELQFHPFGTLWKVANESRMMETWLDTTLDHLKPEEIVTHHTMWTKDVNKLMKQLANEAPIRVVQHLKDKIEGFKPIIPLTTALAKPSLLSRRRHVAKIGELIKVEKLDLNNKTLQDCLRMGFLEHVSAIQELSEHADHEFKLEKQLGKMKDVWQKVTFKLAPHVETHVLKDTDDVRILLDDSLMKAQTMLSSPYAVAILTELEPWERKLARMSQTLDEWLRCQFGYTYLAPIFASEDFALAMPNEARAFEGISSLWIALMDQTDRFPYVVARCADDKLLGQLEDANSKLDKLMRELAKFLDTKRIAFPRFFFLSNEDLIEILSESKVPSRVQPHVKKCFEGIGRLTFTEVSEVVEMISPEQEVVPLLKTVSPAVNNNIVEKWLLKLEESMIVTVRDQIAKAVVDYGATTDPEKNGWVLRWPGQAVLAASMIHWTAAVEDAIVNATLRERVKLVRSQLNDIVTIVRGKVSSVHMATLQALVVLQVHARDIVVELDDDQVSSLDRFAWKAQLRY